MPDWNAVILAFQGQWAAAYRVRNHDPTVPFGPKNQEWKVFERYPEILTPVALSGHKASKDLVTIAFPRMLTAKTDPVQNIGIVVGSTQAAKEGNPRCHGNPFCPIVH